MRIKLVDIELSEPIEPITDLAGYEEVWLLVKIHGLPIGDVKTLVLTSQLEPDMIIDQIVAYLSWPIIVHLLEDMLLSQNGYGSNTLDFSIDDLGSNKADKAKVKTLLSHLTPDPAAEPPCIQWRRSKANWFATVAVCTRNGAHRLENCLQALNKLDYPNYEILIIDNAPEDTSTWEVVARHGGISERLRYLIEPRPGVCWARNRSILEARGDIIAWTDDDSRPDPLWLMNMVAALQRPGVSMVTGPGYPLELQNEVQIYCEKHWGHNNGFSHKEYAVRPGGLSKNTFHTNNFGGSFSLATWRGTFFNIGGFDPALGRGSLSGSASDTDIIYRLLQEGYILNYEPTALVRLVHPSDFSQVERHDYLGTSGLFAFMTKCFINEPQSRWPVLKYALNKLLFWYLWKYLQLLPTKKQQLKTIRLLMLKGALDGPRNYFKAVKKAEEVTAEHGTLEIPRREVQRVTKS